MSFRTFLEEKHKPWSASKEEILQLWQNLKPTNLAMEAVPKGHKGTRLKNDGLRITGSPQFINSVLARLKDLIGYENNPGTRLDLEYRQVESKGIPVGNKYICYVHVEQE